MNKRGQFFLIAALVIAGIIITLTSINFSTKTPEVKTTAVYDLSKEINFESNSLIDYGVFLDSLTIGASLQNLAAAYSAENPDTDLLIVYGNINSYNVSLYNKTNSGRNCYPSNSCSNQYSHEPSEPESWPAGGDNVTVVLDSETSLTFTLDSVGENFYVVLKKESGEETIVSQNPHE